MFGERFGYRDLEGARRAAAAALTSPPACSGYQKAATDFEDGPTFYWALKFLPLIESASCESQFADDSTRYASLAPASIVRIRAFVALQNMPNVSGRGVGCRVFTPFPLKAACATIGIGLPRAPLAPLAPLPGMNLGRSGQCFQKGTALLPVAKPTGSKAVPFCGATCSSEGELNFKCTCYAASRNSIRSLDYGTWLKRGNANEPISVSVDCGFGSCFF